MARPSHSWELPTARAPNAQTEHSWETGTRHSWEGPFAQQNDSDDEMWGECSDDEDASPPPTPASELLSFMISLLYGGVLSCRMFCIILYWVGKCGVREVARYGFHPGAASGHYSRHLEPLLGHIEEKRKLYSFDVPGHSKHDLERTVHTLWMNPGHERLAEEMENDVSFRNKLRERRDARDLPPAYFDHPVVVEAGDEPVAPVAIFVDALPYSITDSIIGFWLVNLITKKRYLMTVVRKRLACQCGCRGWCTFYSVWTAIVWCLICLRDKVYPNARHDGSAWLPGDSVRAQLAGKFMRMRAALVYAKCDWSEAGSTFGFPTWQDLLRPCYVCNAYLANMYRCVGHRVAHLEGWRVNSDNDYEAACRRCEIRVALTDATRRLCVARLRFDRRATGSRGLALSSPIPELGLRTDDRLEPSIELPDVCRLPDAPLSGGRTINVIFWRPGNEDLTRHRCPIFDQRIGVNPRTCMAVDTLHALYLGIFKVWCMFVFWEGINNCTYANVGTQEENQIVALKVIRRGLLAWYDRRHQQRPTERLTRVSDLTPKMLGEKADPALKVKGAECWGLVLFLCHGLSRLQGRFGPLWAILLEAGQCLVQMVDVWATSGTNIPDEKVERCFVLYNRYMELIAPLEIYVPKNHLVYHLLFNIPMHGNPKDYATWLDESLNKVLKGCCRNVSQATFEQTVLVRMADVLRAMEF